MRTLFIFFVFVGVAAAQAEVEDMAFGKNTSDSATALRVCIAAFAATRSESPASRPWLLESKLTSCRLLGDVISPAAKWVVVEDSSGWYWLMRELEAMGLKPHLVDRQQVKQRMRTFSS